MKRLLSILAVIAAAGFGLYELGYVKLDALEAQRAEPARAAAAPADLAPAVTVARARTAELRETVLVTGTLVPRQEVLVAPEVEGLRVVELLADESDRVEKGQVLARLERSTLELMLAQNDAALKKADAAIAQAESNIVSADAREVEARKALERALPLKSTGVLPESTLDQRQSAARTSAAAVTLSRDGLALAQADKAQIEAQRRDTLWKLGKTEVRAPTAGIVSRRSTRLGAVASANVMGEPMFRIVADGDVELEADVPESDMARLQVGQKAAITVAGVGAVAGSVRLVASEVDKTTRLGRVRIALGNDPSLRIGSFGRGAVATRSATGVAVPAAAVLYGDNGTYVQIVTGNRVAARKVVTGLANGDLVEIVSGLAEGDLVVARAGTFLREGDVIAPVEAAAPAAGKS